jgi:hypothetical protein
MKGMSGLNILSAFDRFLGVLLDFQRNYVGIPYAGGSICSTIYSELATWGKTDLQYLLKLSDEAKTFFFTQSIPSHEGLETKVRIGDKLEKLFQKLDREYQESEQKTLIETKETNPQTFCSLNFIYLLSQIAKGEVGNAYSDTDILWIRDSNPPKEYFEICTVLHDMNDAGEL